MERKLTKYIYFSTEEFEEPDFKSLDDVIVSEYTDRAKTVISDVLDSILAFIKGATVPTGEAVLDSISTILDSISTILQRYQDSGELLGWAIGPSYEELGTYDLFLKPIDSLRHCRFRFRIKVRGL
jgi:hypothetical protein